MVDNRRAHLARVMDLAHKTREGHASPSDFDIKRSSLLSSLSLEKEQRVSECELSPNSPKTISKNNSANRASSRWKQRGNHQNSNIKRKALVYLDVNLEGGEKYRVSIYDDDSPHKVAHAFCVKHKIWADMEEQLVIAIEKYLERKNKANN